MYLYLYFSTYLIHLFDHLFIYWRVMFSLSHSLVSLPILLLLSLVLLSTHPIHPFSYSSTHLLIYLPIHLFPVLFPVITHPSICCLFIYALIHLSIPSLISILHLFIYLSLPCVLPTWAKQILYHVLKQLWKNCVCMLTCFNAVQLFVTLWAVAHQAPLLTGFFPARILGWVTMPSSRGSS